MSTVLGRISKGLITGRWSKPGQPDLRTGLRASDLLHSLGTRQYDPEELIYS